MLDHSVHTILQLIGVPDRAEKDEVVKAVMSLKNAEIEEGYTMDVVASRQVYRCHHQLCFFFLLNLDLEMQIK